jgi:hypothetical protein
MIDATGFVIDSTDLPKVPLAFIVSVSDTKGAESMVDREGFKSVSFTSIPERGFDQFKDIARQRKLFPRDVFGDAVRQLLLDRAAGKEITYLASRKGGVRRSLWLEDDLVEGMAEAAQEDNVGKTSFFLTALHRYAEKEGIDVEF